jgi:hypothetical protein
MNHLVHRQCLSIVEKESKLSNRTQLRVKGSLYSLLLQPETASLINASKNFEPEKVSVLDGLSVPVFKAPHILRKPQVAGSFQDQTGLWQLFALLIAFKVVPGFQVQ